uniref:Uncharacterized protein n=1 Tax=viral metagenome TaxID=1070528 RepID=A0A6M3JX81_9ZZZZ
MDNAALEIETASMEPPENTMLPMKKRKKKYGTRIKHSTGTGTNQPGNRQSAPENR